MTADQVEEKSRRRRRRRNNDEAEDLEEDDDRSITAAKGTVTPGRRNRGVEKQDEGNFLTRPFRGFFEYIEGVRDELRKVTWPTREELRRLTVVVTNVTIVSSLVLGTISFAFTEFFILGFDNEFVFLVGGVVGVALYFAASRIFAQSSNEPY